MIRLSQVLGIALAVATLTAADVRADPAGYGQAASFGTTEDHWSGHSGSFTPWGGPGSATDIVCRDGGRPGTIEDLKAPGRGRVFECQPDTDRAAGFAR